MASLPKLLKQKHEQASTDDKNLIQTTRFSKFELENHPSDLETHFFSTLLVVDVTFGEEYIVDLGFEQTLTLASAPPIATGDFDADGVVDCDDANAYVGNLGQPAVGALAELDLDTDGMVTIADAEMLIGDLIVADNGVTGTIIGDVNCDGVVDVLGDAFALVESLGTSGTVYTDGDLDFSGNVDVLGDAFILVGNLGMSNN